MVSHYTSWPDSWGRKALNTHETGAGSALAQLWPRRPRSGPSIDHVGAAIGPGLAKPGPPQNWLGPGSALTGPVPWLNCGPRAAQVRHGYNHLTGSRGAAGTQLSPAGKAAH